MNNLMVTGACGFLGSHLCQFYLERGYNVIGLDNLLTGCLNNINEFKDDSNFTFIEHDVRYKINFKDKLDYILHFASPASPSDYLKFPIETLQIGANGTQNVIDLALKNNATVLVASTSEIYGDPLEHPQSESYYGNVNPIGPRGVYDEAKRYLEALTMAYHKKKNLNVKIVRIFNTYGPKMRANDGRAIPNFINQSLNNNDFTVYGNGRQTRSFCYVDDTVEGINKLLFSNYNLPVNIGNDTEFTILELIKKIKAIRNSSSKIVFKPLPKNDPKVRKPDISLARKILKWKPRVDLDKGLIKTFDYFCNR